MFNKFVSDVAAALGNCEIREVVKNGVSFTGLVVGNGKVRPIVYINEYYDNGLTVEETLTEIKKLTETVPDIALDCLKDFDSVRGLLKVRLSHVDKLFSDVISVTASKFGFNDLVIYPIIELSVGQGEPGSIKVTEDILKTWGVDSDLVIAQAIKNIETDYTIKSMYEVLGVPEELRDDNTMWIVSNNDMWYGASAILGALPELSQKFENGFVVIPSSLHEVIVIDIDKLDSGSINSMINDVNKNVVSAEDFLSNHCYTFQK